MMTPRMKRSSLFLMLTLGLQGQEVKHIQIFREEGRFGGWPANHGIWRWGDEILVGFSAAWYKKMPGDRHQMDGSKPEEPQLARTMDGGETWRVETPKSLLPPEQGGAAVTELKEPMDFTAPGFAMTLRFTNVNKGPSRLWYSNDRGKSWKGPYDFPLFGQLGVAARTDYVVNGKRDCLVFLTASKANGREGRPFMARTIDGGLTWKFVSFIGPEPEGFSIMPSSLRVGPRSLLTTVRVKQDQTHNWIQAWRSEDDGLTWKDEGRVGDTGVQAGNPPSLIRLKDGRLCLTYASRTAPYPVLARLSRDEGKTWGEPIVLRADAVAWDEGYVRSTQRNDGRVVIVYYYNDASMPERFLAATVWRVPE